MAPDPNWNRWIYVSLVKHFSSLSEGILFFVEGQSRPTTSSDYAEIRTDGPFFNEVSHALWEINILVSIIIEAVQNDNDLYKIQRYTGTFISAFERDIPVFKYGDKEDIDTGTVLCCLKLSPKSNEKIRITQFGQVQSGTNIVQASIEARYETILYTP